MADPSLAGWIEALSMTPEAPGLYMPPTSGRYIRWPIGAHEIELEGKFTAAELIALAERMKRKNAHEPDDPHDHTLAVWPIGSLFIGDRHPAFGEWKRHEDLESDPIAGGNKIWERIA